jgi:molybdopterin synthase catalytic subunit
MAQVAVTSEPLDLHALTRELVQLKPPFDDAQGGAEALEGPDTTHSSERVRLKPDTTYSGETGRLKPDTRYDGSRDAARDGDAAVGSGAIVTFTGLVRDHNQGRRVRFLEYEAYVPLAVRALSLIVEETQTAWPAVRVAIHHRVGRLDVGEASVIIAAMSPHRADAFAACRYAIERVKQIVPIWKREHFEGGEVWLEGATADPEDETAKQVAHRIACA